jgi:hypothetical protein
MEWVRRAGEYRTLAGKRDELGFPLAPLEAARLAELERFFTACADPERAPFVQREHIRRNISVVVTYRTGQKGTDSGEARDISGEGLFIACHAPLAVGESTVVRVIDRFSGEEWRFGAEVVRVELGDRPGFGAGMGLRFVGIPLALRVGHRGAPLEPHRKAA